MNWSPTCKGWAARSANGILLTTRDWLEAAHYIETELTGAGYQVRRDNYEIEGKTCSNLEAELGGESREIVLIGAHYDSVFGSPGRER